MCRRMHGMQHARDTSSVGPQGDGGHINHPRPRQTVRDHDRRLKMTQKPPDAAAHAEPEKKTKAGNPISRMHGMAMKRVAIDAHQHRQHPPPTATTATSNE